MILINGKEFEDISAEDISKCIKDIEESFFFEFKDDRVSGGDLSKEISAFSNTYGGYIFIGISDNKEILGCNEWNEERILNVIHDSITPLPIFNIKKVVFEQNKDIYLIQVCEGAEPPYITNKGKIYERISSASCVINDSVKLNNLYIRRKDNENRITEKLSISDYTENVSNIYGYLDIGFEIVSKNPRNFAKRLWEVNEGDIFKEFFTDYRAANISRVGTSLVFNSSALSTSQGQKNLPASVNNFIEIMNDGSVRLRVLFHNNDPQDMRVNYWYATHFVNVFSQIYLDIFKTVLDSEFIYAKKYERLVVKKQFYPYYKIIDEVIDKNPQFKENNIKFENLHKDHFKNTGVDQIITNDRIPKTGFLIVDKIVLDEDHLDFNSKNIVEELFFSKYLFMNYLHDSSSDETNE